MISFSQNNWYNFCLFRPRLIDEILIENDHSTTVLAENDTFLTKKTLKIEKDS